MKGFAPNLHMVPRVIISHKVDMCESFNIENDRAYPWNATSQVFTSENIAPPKYIRTFKPFSAVYKCTIYGVKHEDKVTYRQHYSLQIQNYLRDVNQISHAC